jgi:hypothetical protein
VTKAVTSTSNGPSDDVGLSSSVALVEFVLVEGVDVESNRSGMAPGCNVVLSRDK